jgi:hypothetical protein
VFCRRNTTESTLTKRNPNLNCSHLQQVSLREGRMSPQPVIQTGRVESQHENPRRRVSFSDVAIREFDITFVRAGQDFLRKGPGLSLDWFFIELPTESISDYEKRRQTRRRSHDALLLGIHERRRRLIEDFGFSPAELDHSCKRIFVRSISAPTRMAAGDETRRKSGTI